MDHEFENQKKQQLYDKTAEMSFFLLIPISLAIAVLAVLLIKGAGFVWSVIACVVTYFVARFIGKILLGKIF